MKSMRRGSFSTEVHAEPEVVFDLIHDYDRRLKWDSMLSEARLVGGATTAGVGIRSLCVGTWRTAYLPMETEYVSFERGRVAAVKLTNRPAFFDRFAATIRHHAIAEGVSRVTYIYAFSARPQALALVLEPVMQRALDREIQQRLGALRAFYDRPAAPGS
jgi:hypothetical protein